MWVVLPYVCSTKTTKKAGVAQLVERQLPKLQAVGSNPISRSMIPCSPSGTCDIFRECLSCFRRERLKPWLKHLIQCFPIFSLNSSQINATHLKYKVNRCQLWLSVDLDN